MTNDNYINEIIKKRIVVKNKCKHLGGTFDLLNAGDTKEPYITCMECLMEKRGIVSESDKKAFNEILVRWDEEDALELQNLGKLKNDIRR